MRFPRHLKMFVRLVDAFGRTELGEAVRRLSGEISRTTGPGEGPAVQRPTRIPCRNDADYVELFADGLQNKLAGSTRINAPPGTGIVAAENKLSIQVGAGVSGAE